MSKIKDKERIPVVDLGQLGLGHEAEPSENEWQRVGKKITDAFKHIGFVYLTRHGIPQDQIDRLVKAGATFFDLPQQEKDKYSRDPEKQHGYVAINREKFDQSCSLELRETYDVRGADDPFPDDILPDFRPAAADFLDACKQMTNRILVAMAMGLGLHRNCFVDTHRNLCGDDNSSIVRLLHYPPIPVDTSPDTIRCGAHTDYGTITLLFQDDMGGLHVRDRNGYWISADPIPGTILVNVGDLLQMWTSDKLIATEHRVVIPAEEVRQRKCRRSMAFFIKPDDSVLIQPLDGSLTFQPITSWDYHNRKISATYIY